MLEQRLKTKRTKKRENLRKSCGSVNLQQMRGGGSKKIPHKTTSFFKNKGEKRWEIEKLPKI